MAISETGDHPDSPEFDSITVWLNSLQQADSAAMQQLWDCYFRRLVDLAEQKLRATPVRGSDGEDIAASVLESLWSGAQKGRFADVRNRDELWWLLLALTRRKVASHLRNEQAEKRGGSRRSLSLHEPFGPEGMLLLDLLSNPPAEADLVTLNDTIQHLVGRIPDPRTRQVAVLTLQGFSPEEIAAELNVALVTVRRKLRMIRSDWREELA